MLEATELLVRRNLGESSDEILDRLAQFLLAGDDNGFIARLSGAVGSGLRLLRGERGGRSAAQHQEHQDFVTHVTTSLRIEALILLYPSAERHEEQLSIRSKNLVRPATFDERKPQG